MRTLTSFCFVAAAFIIAACGGGGGGTASVTPSTQAPTATATPTLAPTAQATTAAVNALSSTQVSLGGISSGGSNEVSSSTLTVPATTVSTNAGITFAAAAPGGVAAPAARSATSVRIAGLGITSTLAYITLTFAQSVTLQQGIGLVANLPNAPTGNWYFLFEDPTGTIATGWTNIAAFTIGGATLTASPATLPAPISLKANQPYYFAMATTGANAIQTPTPTATINPVAIPLGGQYSSTTPHVGYVYSCNSSFNGQGASTGPWINTANNTWNATTKLHTQGSVSWPSASNTFGTSGSNFSLVTNDLPVNEATGTYPISVSDPAHQYDGNPNSITAQSLSVLVPLAPVANSTPTCLPLGPIGVTNDGVVFFDAQDAVGRDAGAYEVVDTCNGHPESTGEYHYHSINTACITDTKDSNGHSGLLGYSFDGFGIYGPDDIGGNAMVNANLDVCHGHTHTVLFHGVEQTIYHYHITTEYPYTLGCFRGTPAHGY